MSKSPKYSHSKLKKHKKTGLHLSCPPGTKSVQLDCSARRQFEGSSVSKTWWVLAPSSITTTASILPCSISLCFLLFCFKIKET